MRTPLSARPGPPLVSMPEAEGQQAAPSFSITDMLGVSPGPPGGAPAAAPLPLVGKSPLLAVKEVWSMEGSTNASVQGSGQGLIEAMTVPDAPVRKIRPSEVALHARKGDNWVVISGRVYDVSFLADRHPGGAKVLQEAAGCDCSEEWSKIHPEGLAEALEGWMIGELEKVAGDRPVPAYARKVRRQCAFADGETLQCGVASRQEVGESSVLLRLQLPAGTKVEGLGVGSHVMVSAELNGRKTSRAYTPVGCNPAEGHMDLLVKVYNPTPDFPEGGAMSQHLGKLQVGDKLPIRANKGEFSYLGRGSYRIDEGSLRRANSLGFICAGSGITPALQIIQAILLDPNDETEIWLLYSNKTEKDILARDTIDALAARHSSRFVRWYSITHQRGRSEGWPYSTGRVNEWMLTMFMPPPDTETCITMCGPYGFVNECCLPILEEIGHSNIFCF